MKGARVCAPLSFADGLVLTANRQVPYARYVALAGTAGVGGSPSLAAKWPS